MSADALPPPASVVGLPGQMQKTQLNLNQRQHIFSVPYFYLLDLATLTWSLLYTQQAFGQLFAGSKPCHLFFLFTLKINLIGG